MASVELSKEAFLGLFPEDCQEHCLVAKLAAARAVKQAEELGIGFEKASEILSHRFGRCVLGPEIVVERGGCYQKKTCRNEVIAGVEDMDEASEVLSEI